MLCHSFNLVPTRFRPGERPSGVPIGSHPLPAVVSLSSTSASGYSPTFPQCHTSALFPAAVHDALNIDGMLSSDERAVRDRVRLYMVSLMHTEQLRTACIKTASEQIQQISLHAKTLCVIRAYEFPNSVLQLNGHLHQSLRGAYLRPATLCQVPHIDTRSRCVSIQHTHTCEASLLMWWLAYYTGQ